MLNNDPQTGVERTPSDPPGTPQRPWARRLLTVLLRVAAGGALAAFCVGFVLFAESVSRSETSTIPRAEGIVALTGGTDRIADAIALLASGKADRMLITGVNPSTTSPEIAQMNPKYRGLIECCVDLGYEAQNTTGNAREAERWAERRGIRHSLIVVTSAYHMPRALAEMRHALPDLTLYPFPVVADRLKDAVWWRDPQAAKLVGREYLKYLFALGRLTFVDDPLRAVRHVAASPAPRNQY